MKSFKPIAVIAAILLLAFAFGASAQKAMNAGNQTALKDLHSQALESTMKDIRQAQGVKSNTEINLDKVTNEQLEKLGDAYMDVMHPDAKDHAFMDRMMGGENSESLANMHRMMGGRYLYWAKNGNETVGNCGYGMMGCGQMMNQGNMMGSGQMMNHGNMMGNGCPYGSKTSDDSNSEEQH